MILPRFYPIFVDILTYFLSEFDCIFSLQTVIILKSIRNADKNVLPNEQMRISCIVVIFYEMFRLLKKKMLVEPINLPIHHVPSPIEQMDRWYQSRAIIIIRRAA